MRKCIRNIALALLVVLIVVPLGCRFRQGLIVSIPDLVEKEVQGIIFWIKVDRFEGNNCFTFENGVECFDEDGKVVFGEFLEVTEPDGTTYRTVTYTNTNDVDTRTKMGPRTRKIEVVPETGASIISIDYITLSEKKSDFRIGTYNAQSNSELSAVTIHF